MLLKEKSVIVDSCNSKFVSKNGLDFHNLFRHTPNEVNASVNHSTHAEVSESKSQCEQCNLGVSSKSDHKSHVISVHDVSKTDSSDTSESEKKI